MSTSSVSLQLSPQPVTIWYRIAILLLFALSMTGCSIFQVVERDRCYLAETRYIAMKAIFEESGSYQRAAQAMKDEGWAHCEVNQFRYRLRKDLDLLGREFDILYDTQEPDRQTIDFNPGVVKGAVQ